MGILLGDFQFARTELGPGDFPPMPELRRRRTGDPRDGGPVRLTPDRNIFPLDWRQWESAVGTIGFSLQKAAPVFDGCFVRAANRGGDAFFQRGITLFPKRGHRYRVARTIEGNRLQRRFGREGGRNRMNQTISGLRFWLGSRAHEAIRQQQFPVVNTQLQEGKKQGEAGMQKKNVLTWTGFPNIDNPWREF